MASSSSAIWTDIVLVLLTVLLCLSLIALDGFRPPRRLMVTALLIGLLSPVLLPMLHPLFAVLSFRCCNPVARARDGVWTFFINFDKELAKYDAKPKS